MPGSGACGPTTDRAADYPEPHPTRAPTIDGVADRLGYRGPELLTGERGEQNDTHHLRRRS
jgi:hypothetical protein